MSADARQILDDQGAPLQPRRCGPFELPRLSLVGGRTGQPANVRALSWRPTEGLSGHGSAGYGTDAASQMESDIAYRRGVEDGLRQAGVDAGQQSSTAAEALHKALELFNSSQEQLLRERERDLDALAVAVARKILQREVETDSSVVAGLVRQALELLPTDTTLAIHLHPADLQALPAILEESVPPVRGMTIEWSPDPTLERGSFVMETPLRLINGRADIALRKLYDRMDRHA